MKQVAQNYKSGELTVLDVPRPTCAPGGVLVRSLFSLISTGTELMKVKEASLSFVGKARARPDQVRKVVDTVRSQGAMATYQKVMNKLDSYTPLGYSLCGVVVEVGPGAEEFEVGQLVAAAGNEYALHAHYNWVPVNMCVPVPDGVDPEHAAFATVGSIAMHAVRQSEVQLGDTACVIGLGLVGQLIVRLLVASGVRVLGLDVVEERCRTAEKAGAVLCAAPTDDGVRVVEAKLTELTAGVGADHILLAAGGQSNGPVELAARLARDRARVVDVGKTRLDLPWNAYYDKELDVRFSRSYGPGRYDATYELHGVDYPVGYVRWTQRRNLACFIDLLAREQIDVATLVDRVFPIDDAVRAYQGLRDGTVPGVGFLFEYPDDEPATAVAAPRAQPAREARRRRGTGDAVRLGFVGAGNYASSMLLPWLAKDQRVELSRVATQRSLSAVNAQRKFGFAAVSTHADEVLDDDGIDAVFVVTRHSSHADLACRALERGKAVFVEKPLALTTEDVDRIASVVAATGNDRLMVGFNRRFAPLLVALKRTFGVTNGGAVARYLVNAGRLDADSWYLDQAGEGTRFAGEAGHFVDVLGWWLDSTPLDAYAVRGPADGEVHATFRFADGSVGTVAYLTSGSARQPKETLDVSADGRSARLDNFQRATLWANRRTSVDRARGGQDKGQRAQLRSFVEAVRTDAPMPIAFDSLVATTRATLAAERSLASGRRERV